MTEPVVTDAPDDGRYEADVDGTLAGAAYYERRDAVVVFTHTEVDDAFSGQGLGSVLVAAALDDVRSRGLTILPLCPFVARYVQEHPEYADLVEPSAG